MRLNAPMQKIRYWIRLQVSNVLVICLDDFVMVMTHLLASSLMAATLVAGPALPRMTLPPIERLNWGSM